MNSICKLGITTAVLAGLFVVGCSGEQKQDGDADGGHSHADGGHSHAEAGQVTEVPDSYGAAVAMCEAHTREIAELIESGELHDVHVVAARIRDIARELPGLAKASVPLEMLKEINLKSKELAGLFDAIDNAADSGDKEGTIRAHEQMKTLVAALKTHESHEGHEHEE